MEVEVNGRIFSRVFDVELTQGLVRVNVGDIGTTFDEYANRFGARLLDGGEPVDTSGMTVTGYFLRPNRDTVPIQGRTQTGMVYVDLSPSCYSYDGEFTLVVKVLNGESIGTVLIVDGRIPPSRSDNYIADEESFPDIERIEEMINELEESVDAVLTLNDRVKTLESGIATANSNITKAQNTANDATTKANTANSGVTALGGRVTTLESGLSTTNSKVASVESKADTNASDIADVDAKADENADAIAAVDAKADANASSIASVDAKTKTNANNITALTTRVSNAEKNITSANNSISSASQRITAVETKANNNASDVSKLETTVAGYNTRIAELDSELETVSNKANNAKQAADNNKTLIETVQSTLNETINGIRDENSTQTARINAATDNITALQNNALMKNGHTANKWLSTDSRGNVVTVDGPDAEVTAESITEALGYTPADAENVEVTASSIKKALGYTPAGVNDLLEVEVELKRDKLDNSGHEKGKYLGTDAYGRVVTVEPPSVGSTPVSGPYQMLVSDKDGNTVWEERTHYPYIGRVPVLPEVDYTTIDYVGNTLSQDIAPYMQGEIVADQTYYVTFGTEEFECLAYQQDKNTTVIAENNDWLNGRFSIRSFTSGERWLMVNDGGANPKTTIKVEGPGIEYKKIDPAKYLPEGGVGWTEEGGETVVDMTWTEEIFAELGGETLVINPPNKPVEEGSSYIVNLNGEEYESTATIFTEDDMSVPVLGNLPAIMETGDNGLPFVYIDFSSIPDYTENGMYGTFIAFGGVTPPYTLKINKSATVHKIDEKYLPERSSGSGTKITVTVDADGNYTTDTRLVDVYDMTAAELQAAITVHDGRFEMGVFGLCKYLYGGSVKALVFYMTEASDTERQTTRRMSWLGNESVDQIGPDSNFVEL